MSRFIPTLPMPAPVVRLVPLGFCIAALLSTGSAWSIDNPRPNDMLTAGDSFRGEGYGWGSHGWNVRLRDANRPAGVHHMPVYRGVSCWCGYWGEDMEALEAADFGVTPDPNRQSYDIGYMRMNLSTAGQYQTHINVDIAY